MAADQELEQVRDLLTWAAAAGGWRRPNEDEREGRRKRRPDRPGLGCAGSVRKRAKSRRRAREREVRDGSLGDLRAMQSGGGVVDNAVTPLRPAESKAAVCGIILRGGDAASGCPAPHTTE
jgi:hypothetical protein